MENLLKDLKEKLVFRLDREIDKIQRIETGTNKDSVLISTGKIIELEYLITLLDNMLNYDNLTKK